jgi:mycothiol system anti-sigma-R factor
VSHDHATGSPEDCADFLERIVYLLDNELDSGDIADVKRHLEACSPCFERYDVQRTVKSIVARSCTEHAPDTLRERVLLQIHQVQVRITEQ